MHEMRRHSLGGSGVDISRIGLGGYELGPEPDEQPDAQRAAGVIGAAIEGGVNWLDTSENYLATHNEEVIGEALELVGSDFLVASKVAPGAAITGGGSGFHREQVLKACHDSLARLRRDHLDVYFLHWPDDTGIPLEETWEAMAELADAGLVRAIGLSNYDLEDVERCHRQRRVDVVQVGLSLVDYLEDRPYIASCGELGIAVTIYEPLASGILTGRTMEQILAIWDGPWLESSFYKRLLGPGRAESHPTSSSALAGTLARRSSPVRSAITPATALRACRSTPTQLPSPMPAPPMTVALPPGHSRRQPTITHERGAGTSPALHTV